MAERSNRGVTQEEYDKFLRSQVKGDWAKLENDDPELMASMRESLGIEPGTDGKDGRSEGTEPDAGSA